MAQNVAFKVNVGEYFVWEFTTDNGLEFYLKTRIDAVGDVLDMSTWVYDYKQDTLTLSEDWSDITRNYVYNNNSMHVLKHDYVYENVTRSYGNKTVQCFKITIDSDNIIYVDNATNALIQGKFDQGDYKYDIKLVAWDNINMTDYFYQPEDSIPGYVVFPFVITSILSVSVLILKNKHKKHKKIINTLF